MATPKQVALVTMPLNLPEWTTDVLSTSLARLVRTIFFRPTLKSVGPKLVPFFKTVAIYFVLFIPSDQPSIFAVVIKCLPVLSLIAFVLLHGMSLGEEYAYSRRILLGLIFSVFGDALLIWEDFFVHGLGSFLIAQILYISAFGFRPFNIYVATVVYSLTALGIYLLLPGTSGLVSIGMPIYTFLLMTMVWRAVARVQLFEELWTWTKLCSCVGGILFAVSDAGIGFSAFYCQIPHSQAIIMVSYYAAQLGISLSVVDSKASYLDSVRDNKMQNIQQHIPSDSEDESFMEKLVTSSSYSSASVCDSTSLLVRRHTVHLGSIQ